MKYLIFGTGNYSDELSRFIEDDKIAGYIDSDIKKQGQMFHGKMIYSLEDGLQIEHDYIIIMIQECSKIVELVTSAGVSSDRVIEYHDLWMLEDMPQHMVAKREENSIREWLQGRSGIKIFICSQGFSRTGVPVALMNLAILLRKMNMHVLLGAVTGGPLQKELMQSGIDFIDGIGLQDLNGSFRDQLRGFDIIIIGTLSIIEDARSLAEIGKPVIWWVHEPTGHACYSKCLPENNDNIHYFGGGQRVVRNFKKCYPQVEIEELLYYLPDVEQKHSCFRKKKNFALIGTFQYRKAQDLLMQSILLLPESIREQCSFLFIGRAHGSDKEKIENFCRQNKQSSYIYELDQNELSTYFRNIGVLVCPSRDDPMPVVVTQAMQNGIPCIVSDQVGQSEYIKKMGGGLVFPSENIAELTQCLSKAVTWSTAEYETYSRQAEEIFDSYFSEQVMRKNLEKIIDEILVL